MRLTHIKIKCFILLSVFAEACIDLAGPISLSLGRSTQLVSKKCRNGGVVRDLNLIPPSPEKNTLSLDQRSIMLKEQKHAFLKFTWLCTNGESFLTVTNVWPDPNIEFHQSNAHYKQKNYKSTMKEQYTRNQSQFHHLTYRMCRLNKDTSLPLKNK